MYIYIYIYIYSSTDCFVVSQLNSVVKHACHLKLRSKSGCLYARQISYRRAFANLSISEGIFAYIYICLHKRLMATRVLN